MGLKSTFKKFFDLDDDLDEVLKETFTQEMDRKPFVATQNPMVHRKPGRRPFVENTAPSNSKQPNVVNLKSVHQPTKVMLIEPMGFDDVQAITDHLKQRRSVVFNLGRVSMGEAKRMIDFLSGAVYAINGHIQKLGPDTFMCAPDHVDIDGVISEAMEKRI
jgi:cell division inhibitor SepF